MRQIWQAGLLLSIGSLMLGSCGRTTGVTPAALDAERKTAAYIAVEREKVERAPDDYRARVRLAAGLSIQAANLQKRLHDAQRAREFDAEAVREYETASRLRPGDGAVLILLGSHHKLMGRLTEARATWERAVRLGGLSERWARRKLAENP